MPKCGDPPLPYLIKEPCPICSCPLYLDRMYKAVTKCCTCDKFKELVRCRNTQCPFESVICLQCLTSKPSRQKTDLQSRPDDKKNALLYILVPAFVGLVAVLLLLNFRSSQEPQSFPNKNVLVRLRSRFPSQKNETLYHILSVLEQKVPTVKSIILLHKNDKKTSDCLAKELVDIFSKNLKVKDVSFRVDGIRYRDYGEVLEHYHGIVKKFRVLVTNLNVVSSDVARVFHSLCDEVSSDVKPSLFIFILQWDEKTGNLKPLERATAILKQAWKDLPDSDIFPLLSRVVKNVVDVLPEKQVVC